MYCPRSRRAGAAFAFRGRRGDRLKLLYCDGQGFCLYY
ncbi:IS66 family insertion sequence element accessory protein TnpB [Rhizobium mongolense]